MCVARRESRWGGLRAGVEEVRVCGAVREAGDHAFEAGAGVGGQKRVCPGFKSWILVSRPLTVPMHIISGLACGTCSAWLKHNGQSLET